MFPIMLDLAAAPVILAGNGPQAVRRLQLLDDDHAGAVTVHAPDPSGELAEAAGARLVRRWPTPAEIASARLVLIADDVERTVLSDLVAIARAAGTLTNVEDRPELSDFHSPAVVRRGDLVVTVSTGGRSPGLARRLGRFLAEVFGPEWQERLEDLAALRAQWREGGADPSTVGAWTETWVERHGRLPAESETAAAALRQAAQRMPAAAARDTART
jgi:precorrin-2 dehydrogenase/sirohydrochlorin ferrochelatase